MQISQIIKFTKNNATVIGTFACLITILSTVMLLMALAIYEQPEITNIEIKNIKNIKILNENQNGCLLVFQEGNRERHMILKSYKINIIKDPNVLESIQMTKEKKSCGISKMKNVIINMREKK